MPRKTGACRLRNLERRDASMRPRPDAAENAAGRCPASTGRARFNEAAARCRGKHSQPNPNRSRSFRCFNEAAARCRGKRGKLIRLDELLNPLQ